VRNVLKHFRRVLCAYGKNLMQALSAFCGSLRVLLLSYSKSLRKMLEACNEGLSGLLRMYRRLNQVLAPPAEWRGMASRLYSSEVGELDIGGIMLMGIGMIFLAVGFIIYPIILDATDAIYAWSANLTSYYTITDFTGCSAITGIIPLVTLLGFISAGAITGFMGFKVMKTGASATVSPGSLMLLGIGLIFISVALIIFPVVLDGVAASLDAAIIAATYTGLVPILRVTPLIVLSAFMTGGIVAGFFGIKGIQKQAGV
jgi:hypothetical protein